MTKIITTYLGPNIQIRNNGTSTTKLRISSSTNINSIQALVCFLIIVAIIFRLDHGLGIK